MDGYPSLVRGLDGHNSMTNALIHFPFLSILLFDDLTS